MKQCKRLVSWQPVLTDHQAYTYEALARKSGLPFIAYVSDLEDATRKAQGWTDTQVTQIERRLIPQQGFLKFCYSQLKSNRNAIHLFGSPFQQPKLMLCWLMAGCLGVEYYVISEPYSPIGLGYLSERSRFQERLKALMRPWIYWIYAHVLRSQTAGIFAISRRALQQFRKGGMPASKLFPFGYFVPKSVAHVESKEHADSPSGSKLRLVFVGSLLQIKGIDLLNEVARQLANDESGVSIDVYGPGNFSAFENNIPGWRYAGVIPFGQAQSVMARYDALVIPSRYDGWGVVVNEALCAGIPVICSDQVGSGVLLENFGAGLRFPSGDVAGLCERILELRDWPDRLSALKKAAKLAAKAIQPEVAADYMWEVMLAAPDEKSTISAPWYSRDLP